MNFFRTLCLCAFVWNSFFLYAQEYYFEDDEGITITGTQQTSQQISIIGKEEIESRNSADLADLLQDTLGLNIVRYGSYGNQAGVNLRGFDGKRVAFLIDGVPANSSMDGKFDISQIDLNNVERIEVIYGGSDSQYNVSGSLGGVINIVTIKKQPLGWQFGLGASNTSAMPGRYRNRNGNTAEPHWEDLLDAQNYSLSTAYGGEDFSFSANTFFNRAQNHFLFQDFAGYTRRKDNNEVWDTGLNTSMIWTLQDLTKIIASSNFYYGDKNFPSSGFSVGFGNQRDFSTRQSIMLEVPRAGHDNISAEASLTWNFNRLDYTSPASELSRYNQHNLYAINRWSWFCADKLTLRSGIDFNCKFLDSTEIGNRNRYDGGVYITAEWKPIEQLIIIPSVKTIFLFNEELQIEFIPKLGLLWNVTDSFAIKNNYFRSFKFPDFEELYWSGSGGVGTPDLKSEDGWGADIGTDWRINKWVQIENTVFAQWLVNSIHWYSGSDNIWRPENVGEAVFLGLDNKLNFTLPSFKPFTRIMLSISYTYLRSYLLSFGYDFNADKRIPYNPEHTIGGSLDFSWITGNVIISGYYEGLRFHDRANLTALIPYFLLNLNVNQGIGESVTVFCALRNILNYSYESFYDYPMQGFTATIGARINISQRRGDAEGEK